MSNKPTITLTEALNAYLDEYKKREKQYEDAKAFCIGDDKAINALHIVNCKTKVILDEKFDFITRLFDVEFNEAARLLNDIRKERERTSK